MEIDNNCLITRTSHCALDLLMAGASRQDQLMLLCLRPPPSCHSCQAAEVPVHGGPWLLPIWHPHWASGNLCPQPGGSASMQPLGGTGRGKFPDLQKADEEQCCCPVFSRPFQTGMRRWTGSTMGDGTVLEVPTSFPLCPLRYGIPSPLVAVVNLSRALVLALGSFILIFALTCLLPEPTTSHFFCKACNEWMTLDLKKSLERYSHYCSNWCLCPSGQ